jgi:archaeal flagellar protein FlaJ
MKLEVKNKHIASMIAGGLIIVVSAIFFWGKWYLNPLIVIGLMLGAAFFITDTLNESKRQKELELKFLEFVRSLVESVRSGISVPQAITHVAKEDYGALTPYVRKLSSQIGLGFPLHAAFTNFAKDTKNEVVTRSVSIVIQAEKSGGDMASVLEAVTKSVYEIKKVKEEQKSNSYSQTIQGYVIFFVFLMIMIVMQVYLLPKLGDIGGELGGGLGGGMASNVASAAVADKADLSGILLATIVIQGLFAGLMLGKFADDDFKLGIKHSIILCVGGYLIMSTAMGLFGVTGEAEATVVAAVVFLVPWRWLKRLIRKG